jgi:pyrophosphatase PpaX
VGAERRATGGNRHIRPHSVLSPQSSVLFDLDGTLIDSVELIVRSYHHATMTHLEMALERAAIVRTIGLPLDRVMEEIAPGRGATLVATYREYMSANHDDLVGAFPGVLDLLRALRERGYRLGIVTAKHRPAASLAFRLCGLDALVDVTICGDDTTRHKPFPDPLLAAAAQLAVEPQDCLYVGDAPTDLQAAHAAEMRAVAATWGAGTRDELAAASPHLWLTQPLDLLAHCTARIP